MNERKLHIGGRERCSGWEIFSDFPGVGVDHLGDPADLSRFPDNTFTALFATNFPVRFDDCPAAVKLFHEWHRVLVPGGEICISTYDIDTLAGLYLEKEQLPREQRVKALKMISASLGERRAEGTGSNYETLAELLAKSCFSEIGLADRDTFPGGETSPFNGTPVTLCVRGKKNVSSEQSNCQSSTGHDFQDQKTEAKNFSQQIATALKHQEAGELEVAGRIYQEILEHDSDNADANHLLGVIAAEDHGFDRAIELISKAIHHRPGCALYHINLGKTYGKLKKYENAIFAYQTALKKDPANQESFFCMANIYVEQEKFDLAIAYYEKTIQMFPNHAAAYNGMGVVFHKQKHLDHAASSFNKAIQLQPGNPEFHTNLGAIMHEQGMFAAEEEILKRALAIDPGHANGRFNLSVLQLLIGRIFEGWEGYEWRWKKGDYEFAKRNYCQPLWDGSDIAGKTFLVQHEQGMGDEIHFCRYVPFLAERGAKVIFECSRSLMKIMENLPGVAQVVEKKSQMPHFDIYCPLMSLPYRFQTDLETIPAEIPYLHPHPETTAEWRKRLAPFKDTLKVGLVWAGNPLYSNDHMRSIPAVDFLPLFDLPGIHYFSLMPKRLPAEMLEHQGVMIEDLSNYLTDFNETAAAMMELDLVISVDTAPAHLAGALGRKTWLLLPYMPDWRWMLARDDSPWYPTMRLFRQPLRGAWHAVLQRVIQELKKISKTK